MIWWTAPTWHKTCYCILCTINKYWRQRQKVKHLPSNIYIHFNTHSYMAYGEWCKCWRALLFVLVLHIAQPLTQTHTHNGMHHPNTVFIIILSCCSLLLTKRVLMQTQIYVKEWRWVMYALVNTILVRYNKQIWELLWIFLSLPNCCYHYVHKFSLKVISQSLNNRLSYVLSWILPSFYLNMNIIRWE